MGQGGEARLSCDSPLRVGFSRPGSGCELWCRWDYRLLTIYKPSLSNVKVFQRHHTTLASPSAHSATIELLQSHSLTTLVQRELERRILEGDLAPGAKLNEEDIAGDLNVSRGPVREAFRALESAGPVRTEKNRGGFVRQGAIAEADEIYEGRAGLDELIGGLLPSRIQPSQLTDL